MSVSRHASRLHGVPFHDAVNDLPAQGRKTTSSGTINRGAVVPEQPGRVTGFVSVVCWLPEGWSQDGLACSALTCGDGFGCRGSPFTYVRCGRWGRAGVQLPVIPSAPAWVAWFVAAAA